ncbi:hypothetical protein SISSUDRAFT_983945 [Sistotremastrum suecicum HHB10207 ss-3]|uniref:GTP-binding protein n=1 Tax=Sistotremastrum suecicum HHB10207 ss-3 TaxID=1314776 RepID=A0A166EWL0_9AGAM|nr:hypothetical protein SISSUDRAFT_983945 [Sistotremastrum suecicum HHB10207 ss-3]
MACRSGKTSIQRVVFERLPAKQTFYLDTSTRINKYRFNSVIPLEIWDCPANVTLEQLSPLSQFSSIIFVIDIIDKFSGPVNKLVDWIAVFYAEKPDINVEVFAHKEDAITVDDYKLETFGNLQRLVVESLADALAPPTDDQNSPSYFENLQIPVSFHLTSVYNHSIYEAFSKTIHKLIEPLSYIEDLLNIFCANSQCAKAFLFDTNARLYVATDTSPVDSGTHNLCCDYVLMLNQLAPLYKYDLYSTSIDANKPEVLPTGRSPTRWASSSTRLKPDSTLTYWQVTPNMAVVTLLRTELFQTRRGLIEYNLVFLREGIQEILEVENLRQRGELTNVASPTSPEKDS